MHSMMSDCTQLARWCAVEVMQRMTMDHDSVSWRGTLHDVENRSPIYIKINMVRESSWRSWDAIAGRHSAKVISNVGSPPVVPLLARISRGAVCMSLSTSHFLARFQLFTSRMCALPAFTAMLRASLCRSLICVKDRRGGRAASCNASA